MATRRPSDAGGFGWAEPELMVEDKADMPLVEAVRRPLDRQAVRAALGQRPSAASVQLARGSALELGVSATLRGTINAGLQAAWGALLRSDLQAHALQCGQTWFVPSLRR